MTNESGGTTTSARSSQPAPASARRNPADDEPPGTTAAAQAGEPTAPVVARQPNRAGSTGPAVDLEDPATASHGEPASHDEPVAPRGVASVSGAGVLAALALAYLVAIMRSAQATIADDSGALAVTSAAYALPGVVSAILVAGTALGLLAIAALTRWVSPGLAERAGRRCAAALGAGLLVGLAAASTVVAAYGTGMASMVLAGTVAAAGTIGGAIAGLRARHVVAAAVSATLAVFAIGFVLNFFKTPLLSLYGFGDSQQSRLGAYGWFAMTAALAGGLAAGAVAFGQLRRTWRSAVGSPLGTGFGYLAAGAGPGLMLLLGEVITRLGGARVLEIVSAVSAADGTGQSLLDASRLKYALIVLFVGGLTAMIAFGRTVRPSPTEDDDAS